MTNDELKAHFWDLGNLISTDDGVEIEYFAEESITVSVTLRNHEAYADRYQLRSVFDNLKDFMLSFDIASDADLRRVSVTDLLGLYKKDMADIDHFEYPID